MQKKNLISNIAIIAVVVAFAVACCFTGDIMSPVGTLWSLFPPVVAIGLALITKEVYSSLFVGILAGGLLATNFNVVKTTDSMQVLQAYSSSLFSSVQSLHFLTRPAVPVLSVNGHPSM